MAALQLVRYTNKTVEIHNQSCREEGVYKELLTVDGAARLVCRGHDLYQQLLPNLRQCENEARQGVETLTQKQLSSHNNNPPRHSVRMRVFAWRVRQLENITKCLNNWTPEMNDQVIPELRKCGIPITVFREAEERAKVGVFLPWDEEPDVRQAMEEENEASWKRLNGERLEHDEENKSKKRKNASEADYIHSKNKEHDKWAAKAYMYPWYKMQGLLEEPLDGKPWMRRTPDAVAHDQHINGNMRPFPVVPWSNFRYDRAICFSFQANDVLSESEQAWLQSNKQLCGLSDISNRWDGFGINVKIPPLKTSYVGTFGLLWYTSFSRDKAQVSRISFDGAKPNVTSPVPFSGDWESLKENALGVLVDNPEKIEEDRESLRSLLVALTRDKNKTPVPETRVTGHRYRDNEYYFGIRKNYMSTIMYDYRYSKLCADHLLKQVQRVLDSDPGSYFSHKNHSRQHDPLPDRLSEHMYWWVDEELLWDVSQPDPPAETGPPRDMVDLWEDMESPYEHCFSRADLEAFDVSLDGSVAWQELPLNVFTEDLLTEKPNENCFNRDSRVGFSTAVEEDECPWKHLSLNVVKHDDATPEQVARAGMRAHKKYSENAMEKRRKKLLQNVVNRSGVKLSEREQNYYEDWSQRIQAGWEKFQVLCGSWKKGFIEHRSDNGPRITIRDDFWSTREKVDTYDIEDASDVFSVLGKHWYSLYAPSPPGWWNRAPTFHCLPSFNTKYAHRHRAKLVAMYAREHGVKMNVLCSIYAWMPRMLAATRDLKFLCTNGNARNPTFTEEIEHKDYGSHVRSILKKSGIKYPKNKKQDEDIKQDTVETDEAVSPQS